VKTLVSLQHLSVDTLHEVGYFPTFYSFYTKFENSSKLLKFISSRSWALPNFPILTKSGTFTKFGHCVQAFNFKFTNQNWYFKLLFQKRNIFKSLRKTGELNEVLMRQQDFFLLKRKMDAFASTNSGRSAV